MNELEAHVETLGPMRVATFRAVSETPERDALEKLCSWAGARALLDDLESHPVFGFNHPSPSPDRKEYGYEFWIRVDPDVAPEGEVEIKDFPGGHYAVTTCRLLGDPTGSVPEVWKKLWDWVQSSEYTWRKTHELEKLHDPRVAEEDAVIDLYLPIEE
jgi:DNA gyrase inhibitor GyrI